MFNADNVSNLLPMTPEQRIKQAKIVYGYLPENTPFYTENINTIKEVFGTYSLFKKSSKIYWSYRVSPLYEGEVLIKPQDYPYYISYKNFILQEKFSKVI